MEPNPLSRRATDGKVENEAPTKEEVKQVLLKLKNNRSPGPDIINSELLKVDKPELVDKLQIIMEQVWRREEIPTQWEVGTICPIHKKGDQLECGNYRGITLLNTAYKIFYNILFERFEPYVNNILGNY
jgi:sorting nexin-29